MNYKFNIGDFYKNWDCVHYETVAILILEDDTTDPEDVVVPMMTALCQMQMFKSGDKYKIAKAGNTIIIGKAHLYLEMDSLDGVN